MMLDSRFWRKEGYTESHQTVVNVLDYDDGKIEPGGRANIIVNEQLISKGRFDERHHMHQEN